MTVYNGPVFDMAVKQFGIIADYLAIALDERDRVLMPKRALRAIARAASPWQALRFHGHD